MKASTKVGKQFARQATKLLSEMKGHSLKLHSITERISLTSLGLSFSKDDKFWETAGLPPTTSVFPPDPNDNHFVH